jgi:hypothetical protein
MKSIQRVPRGFRVQVNHLGLGRFDVSVSHLGQRVAFFARGFASRMEARQTGISSAVALADCVQRGVKLLACRIL